MATVLTTLMQGLIDYAGLFPPARLDLEDAFCRYQAYREGDESRILGRFVCPASKLGELAALVGDKGTTVAVVGSGGEWASALEGDARWMSEFEDRAPQASIAAYETRLPPDGRIESVLRDLGAFCQVDAFLELPLDDDLPDRLSALAENGHVLAKARAGGDSVPSKESLAGFLHGCVSLDLPFKLTAGLHHLFASPERHGLLNVLGAVALALAEDLSKRQLGEILASDRRLWKLGDGKIGFEDYEADVDDAAFARDLFRSVGSCSVDEPMEELRALNLVGGEKR
jgi:hypothetical protein